MLLVKETDETFFHLLIDSRGWLLFTNITITDSATEAAAYQAVQNPSNISQLYNVQSGNFYLSREAMHQLYRGGNYNELRMSCYKPYHGRTLDAVVYGAEYIDLLFDRLTKTGMCGTVQFLPGDTSFTQSHCSCGDLKFGGMHYLYCSGLYHIVIGESNRFLCDDQYDDDNFNSNGYWLLYLQ